MLETHPNTPFEIFKREQQDKKPNIICSFNESESNEHNDIENKENIDTFNLPSSNQNNDSNFHLSSLSLNKKPKHEIKFDSFFQNELLYKDAKKISKKPLQNTSNFDHYHLENIVSHYQEPENSPIPKYSTNKTMVCQNQRESPKSMHDFSFLNKSQKGASKTPVNQEKFFINDKHEKSKILNSRENLFPNEKFEKTMEIEKFLQKALVPLVSNTNKIPLPKQPEPLIKCNTYMDLAKKAQNSTKPVIKKVKTFTTTTFHFEKKEKKTTYIDILRRTFNKLDNNNHSQKNSSIFKQENNQKVNDTRKANFSARNKTQDKAIIYSNKNLIHNPIIPKKISRETFICNQKENSNTLTPIIASKATTDRLSVPKFKIVQKNFMNANQNPINENLLKNTSSINSSSNILYDQVSLSEFKMEKVLGQGSYASVKLAFEKATNKKFAIKIYEKYRLTDPHRMNNVKREISILKKLEHQNIIKLFYALDEKRQILLIMEYIGHTSLHAYLKGKPGRKLDEKEAKRLFLQIVQAISYCHSKNVVHRDIKLENILLDERLSIKIIDFGFSITSPSSKKLNIFCGTPSYMAPEIVSKTLYNGHATDVWALGILLYVLLHGSFPFKGVDDKDLFRKIGRGKFDVNENLSRECKTLIHAILKVNPHERANTNQILQSPWFF